MWDDADNVHICMREYSHMRQCASICIDVHLEYRPLAIPSLKSCVWYAVNIFSGIFGNFSQMPIFWHLLLGIIPKTSRIEQRRFKIKWTLDDKIYQILPPPVCKTCFSTSKWIWHTKNDLVNLQKFWNWEDPNNPAWKSWRHTYVAYHVKSETWASALAGKETWTLSTGKPATFWEGIVLLLCSVLEKD